MQNIDNAKNTNNEKNGENPKNDEEKLTSLVKEIVNHESETNFPPKKQQELLEKILKELDL